MKQLPDSHRFRVEKLIRDDMPQLMRISGIEVFHRIMETEEYIAQLKAKLLEESHEACDARSVQELQDELADVFEVVLALATVHGITLSSIQANAEKKRQAKGGFESKVYVKHVEIPKNHPALSYYRSRPEKYPEVA